MNLTDCKRHLRSTAAAWLDASDLTDLNLTEPMTAAQEQRWERAKHEVVRALYGPRQRHR